MADQLPDPIKCGESSYGTAEVSSPPSITVSWTKEIEYGPAYRRAVDDLDQHDATYKQKAADKLDHWMDTVKCVKSVHCEVCKKNQPNYAQLQDVSPTDHVHAQTGSPMKSGTMSLVRNYSVKSTGPVTCICHGSIVINAERRVPGNQPPGRHD